MKNIIFAIIFVMSVGIISGCGTEDIVNNVQKSNNSQEQGADNNEVANDVVEKNEYINDIEDEELENMLGENNVPENEMADIESEVVKIEMCDDGFIYHTELKECFEIGGTASSEDAELKIDPIVKECIDKGGIYNAQIEKCFID